MGLLEDGRMNREGFLEKLTPESRFDVKEE